MITGVDHLVVLVRSLDQAMEDYAQLGFTVERGGAHPAGTINALIALADGAYLELIAFPDPDQPTDHPWYSALADGTGLVAFALGLSDLAADAAAMRVRGLTVDDLQDGSRMRPDGSRVAWRNTGVGDGPRGRQRPFLIEDVTPRAMRVASGPLARHANSVVSVVDVTLAVNDLERATADLAALLDQTAPPATESEGLRRVRFTTPRGDVIAAQALDPYSTLGLETAKRGDHLHAATLGAMLQGGEPSFSVETAHGANLRLVPV